MRTFKIECPHCQQHIECDERYCGVQLKCPACQQEMMIPRLDATPTPAVAPTPEIAPPPVHALRPVAVSVTPATAAPTAPPPGPAPIRIAATPVHAPAPAPLPSTPRPMTPRPMPAVAADDESPGMSKGKKLALIAALVVIVPAALYFIFSMAGRMQSKFNDARAKDDDPGMVAGQVGHIAELNKVLDATDPDKLGRFDNTPWKKPDEPVPVEFLPANPAVWTLDLNAAKTPDGRVAGSVAGSNFVSHRTVLLTGGAMPVLAFRHGESAVPEREVVVFVRLKPGEKLEGKTVTVSREQTADVTPVMKKWKPATAKWGDPMQQRTFNNGYVMKLEFEKMTRDGLAGKIYLAMPDVEHSAIGGLFIASVQVLSTGPGKGGPVSRPAMGGDE